MLRMKGKAIPKTAVHWTPDGKRQQGPTQTTWRRMVESEQKILNYIWGDIERKECDTHEWRNFVAVTS